MQALEAYFQSSKWTFSFPLAQKIRQLLTFKRSLKTILTYCLVSAALFKVPQGAWFTLTLATVLASVLILWRFGKEQQWAAEAEDRFPTTHLVVKNEDGSIRLTDRYGGETLSVIRGFGIFFDKAGETTPAVFSQFLTKLVAAPEVCPSFVHRLTILWLTLILDYCLLPSQTT
jgi:KUP system potassium uptake protein